MSFSEKLPQIQTVERLFFVLLCSLFAATGLNVFFYPVFYAAGGTALYLLIQSWGDTPAPQRWLALFPLPFILYTAISPGCPFKDLPIADKMFTSCLIGLATFRLPRPLLFRAIAFLPFALTLLFACALITAFPQSMELDGRLQLWFTHPNILGFIGIWCILFLSIFPRNLMSALFSLRKMTRLGIILVLLAAVLLSGSRASLLGGIGACLALAILHLSSLPRQAMRRHISVVLAVCLGIGLFGYAVLPETQRQRILSAILSPAQDATFQSRLNLWHVAWEGITDKPLIGNALRTFPSHYDAYMQQNGDSLKQNLRFVDEQANHPHNLYMGLAFAYGGIGLALLALCFAPAIINAWRQQNFFFLAVVLLYLAHGFFDYPLHRKDGILLLFFPLGMLYGDLYLKRPEASGAVGQVQQVLVTY